MREQRRHQRIRFGVPPAVKLGYGGVLGEGLLENISLSGVMIRTDMQLDVGRTVGCEFSIHGSPMIDVPATVVSRVGDLFGARFQSGPIAMIALEDAMSASLASGKASVLSLHEVAGKRLMRVSGGLGGCLRNDFMHALTVVGVEQVDLSGVTYVEQDGLALCLLAVTRYGIDVVAKSACFAEAWQLATMAQSRGEWV